MNFMSKGSAKGGSHTGCSGSLEYGFSFSFLESIGGIYMLCSQDRDSLCGEGDDLVSFCGEYHCYSSKCYAGYYHAVY